MSQPRTYSSPARDESARQTRRRIVAAAGELFESQGYAGTTIDAVAARAGVSRRTVFVSVGSKSELLKTALDWALVGDDEPVAMADRPQIRRIREVGDPAELVRLWVAHLMEAGDRVAPLSQVLARAVDADAEAALLQERIDAEQRLGAAMFVAHVASVGGLREGLAEEEAADMCWILMNPLLQLRMRRERGWSRDAFEAWLTRLVAASLLA